MIPMRKPARYIVRFRSIEGEFTVDNNDDMVRFELMKQFGYYVTESSEHSAEYYPYFIKKEHPELIKRFNIPLDEYPRRCLIQIEEWAEQAEKLIHDEKLTHTHSHEYASGIIEAIETGKPFSFGGNVMNTGLIDNLPADCCVEVTCLANEGGIQPCHIGALPHQLAALNMRQISVHSLQWMRTYWKKGLHLPGGDVRSPCLCRTDH